MPKKKVAVENLSAGDAYLLENAGQSGNLKQDLNHTDNSPGFFFYIKAYWNQLFAKSNKNFSLMDPAEEEYLDSDPNVEIHDFFRNNLSAFSKNMNQDQMEFAVLQEMKEGKGLAHKSASANAVVNGFTDSILNPFESLLAARKNKTISETTYRERMKETLKKVDHYMENHHPLSNRGQKRMEAAAHVRETLLHVQSRKDIGRVAFCLVSDDAGHNRKANSFSTLVNESYGTLAACKRGSAAYETARKTLIDNLERYEHTHHPLSKIGVERLRFAKGLKAMMERELKYDLKLSATAEGDAEDDYVALRTKEDIKAYDKMVNGENENVGETYDEEDEAGNTSNDYSFLALADEEEDEDVFADLKKTDKEKTDKEKTGVRTISMAQLAGKGGSGKKENNKQESPKRTRSAVLPDSSKKEHKNNML